MATRPAETQVVLSEFMICSLGRDRRFQRTATGRLTDTPGIEAADPEIARRHG
jgi:hypothetical protein